MFQTFRLFCIQSPFIAQRVKTDKMRSAGIQDRRTHKANQLFHGFLYDHFYAGLEQFIREVGRIEEED